MTKTTVVMQTAWKIARHGAKTFGGNVRDYLSTALKMAWEAVKKGMIKVAKKVTETAKATLETKMGSKKHKSWVAALTGTNGTYKFDRTFVNDFKEDYPTRVYTLTDGLYDVCDGGDRKYIQVSNGSITTITESDAVASL